MVIKVTVLMYIIFMYVVSTYALVDSFRNELYNCKHIIIHVFSVPIDRNVSTYKS